MKNTKSNNLPSISELLLERDKIVGDFVQALGDWLTQFNSVTDKMIDDLYVGSEREVMDMDGVDDRRDDSGKYEAVEHA
jgi:hypothetical protein